MYGKERYISIQQSSLPLERLSTEKKKISLPSQPRPWKSGLRRIPILGLLSIGGVILCTALSVYVLYRSDGQPVSSWHPLQPTVYLAVLSSVSNVLLSFALGEGLVVSFWQKSTRASTLRDLHQTWYSGTSLRGALLGLLTGRGKVMAMACLLTTLSIARGPLFQRASSIREVSEAITGSVTVHAAQSLQYGYAGSLSGRTSSPAYMNSYFSSVVQSYSNREPMTIASSDCPQNATCSFLVKGFGFGVSCNETVLPYVMENVSGNSTTYNAIDVFSVSVGYEQVFDQPRSLELDENFNPVESENEFALILNSTYKTDPNTPLDGGELQNRICAVRGGIVNYQVLINNGTTLTFRSSSHQDDTFLERGGFTSLLATSASNLAGFVLAARYLYESTATLSFGGAVGYILTIDGLTAARYAAFNSSAGNTAGVTAWTDPTDDILDAMREIAFRTSLQVASQNASYPESVQNVEYTGTQPVTVYHVDWRFMVAAVLVSLVGTISVLPTFIGFYHLGRSVTLSPLEIAKAFEAPILKEGGSNVDVDDLLKEVGRTRVRYGEVLVSGGDRSPSTDVVVVRRLAVGGTEAVTQPRKDEMYI